MQNGDNHYYTITTTVKDILDVYDTDRLLTTIPKDYIINPRAIEVYSNRLKLAQKTKQKITLNIQSTQYLNAMAQNYNVPVSLMFNFLIETVCNCGKINTKKVTEALDIYYNLMTTDKTSTQIHELRQRLLDRVCRQCLL